MGEVRKYLIRFGITLMIAIPFAVFAGEQALKILFYKIAMVAVGVAFAELIWAAFFKVVYGRTEDMLGNEKIGIFVFRGILYAAIIVALTLGL